MSKLNRKWSPARRKAFEERRAAKQHRVPLTPDVLETAYEAVVARSPFVELMQAINKFHDRLMSSLNELHRQWR